MATHRLAPPLLTLGALYVAQALPIGFYQQALPVLLRDQGYSLRQIGLVQLVALPWVLKWLWAATLDRRPGPLARLGQRRGWIVPLQLVAAGLCFALAMVDLSGGLAPLLIALLLLNLACATQDIATDGLAVLLLARRERGPGNSAQAAGYQLGLIVGGGLLLLAFSQVGWAAMCALMGALMLLPLVPLLLLREPTAPTAATESAAHTLRPWADLRAYLAQPQAGRWLLLLATFLLGSVWAMAMVKPLLIDAGLSVAQVGWLNGVWGIAASVVGSLVGGWLLTRLRRGEVVVLCLALLFGGVGLLLVAGSGVEADLSAPAGEAAAVGGVGLLTLALLANKAIGGLAGTTLFTLMMDHTRPATPGHDFTVQQSTFNVATMSAALAGVLADAIGYTGLFVLCLALTTLTAWAWVRHLELVTSGRLSGQAQAEPDADPPGEIPS